MVSAVRRYDRVFQTGSQQRSDSKFRFARERERFPGDEEANRMPDRAKRSPWRL